MEIFHDHSYITQADKKFISRGYACESFYFLRFSFVYTKEQQAENQAYAEAVGLDSDAWSSCITASARRRSEHMERIVNLLAQNFKICQYDKEKTVPYNSDWDLFFWCNDFSSTMQGLLSGRDYGYFTLAFNSEQAPEQRRKIYDRAMRILELFSDDENLHIAVQYTAIMDDAKIKRDAALAGLGIAGRNCVYKGMEGRVETNGEALYFRKKRSRKYVYRLTDAAVLSLSWQLSA
jgi:hypothetical protein